MQAIVRDICGKTYPSQALFQLDLSSFATITLNVSRCAFRGEAFCTDRKTERSVEMNLRSKLNDIKWILRPCHS